MIKQPNIDALIDEICRTGCRVSWIKDTKATEFVDKLVVKHQAKEKPNIQRAADILKEIWGIEIDRRALSEHVRGRCGCQKKTK